MEYIRKGNSLALQIGCTLLFGLGIHYIGDCDHLWGDHLEAKHSYGGSFGVKWG